MLVRLWFFQFNRKYIVFLFLEYVLIDAEKGCSHAKADPNSKIYDITRCVNDDLTINESDCKEYCSTSQSCVGYEYEHNDWDKREVCRLFPADERCSTEFRPYKRIHTAKSNYDLVPGRELWRVARDDVHRACHAKKPGKFDQTSSIKISSSLWEKIATTFIVYTYKN